MTHFSSTWVLDRLDRAAGLLLNPHAAALDESRQSLGAVADALRGAPIELRTSPEIRKRIRGIRRLLDDANEFWAARRRRISPGANYSPTGLLTVPPGNSTFAVEG